MKAVRPHSSRQRYRRFADDYKHKRLDAVADAVGGKAPATPEGGAQPAAAPKDRKKRRGYLRQYFRWLWPYRYAVGFVFFLALINAGLDTIQPLFMRYIIDNVLLDNTLDGAGRLRLLNLGGGLFVLGVVIEALVGLFKDSRQRILNVRVMLSLRR